MKLKKVLASVLAASTALTMAGCSGDNTSGGSTPAGNTSNGSGSTTSGGASGGTSDSASSGSGESGEWWDTSLTKSLKVDETNKDAWKGMELEVWTNRTDRLPTSKNGNGYLEEMVKPFEEHYGVKIKWDGFQDYNKTVTQRLTGNNCSADVLVDPGQFEIDEYKDYFLPLGIVSDLRDYNDITNKSINEDANETDSEKATVYGVPTGCNGTGLTYNKKVWADAGITTLPKTVDDFINDLRVIKEKNPDVVPIMAVYTGGDGFSMKEYTQWASAISGDPDFKVKLMVNGGDIFTTGSPYYEMCRMMFEVYRNQDLREKDPTTTDWEACKMLLAQGKVGTFAIGSWAVEQFKEAGKEAGVPDEELENITLMPVPYTAADGKQYCRVGSDTVWTINKKIDAEKTELAKAFIKWWAEKSTYCKDQGFIPVLANADKSQYPACFEDWAGITYFTEKAAPAAISKSWSNIDKKLAETFLEETKLDENHFKVRICQLGMAGGTLEEFQAILAEQNKNWSDNRLKNEALAAFIETPEAEKYKDENFAKKQDW